MLLSITASDLSRSEKITAEWTKGEIWIYTGQDDSGDMSVIRAWIS